MRRQLPRQWVGRAAAVAPRLAEVWDSCGGGTATTAMPPQPPTRGEGCEPLGAGRSRWQWACGWRRLDVAG